MILRTLSAAAIATALIAAPAAAQRMQPMRPMSAFATPVEAMPYLMKSGASDLFEIQSSQLALEKTQNPDIRRYAQMMIEHHTRTTEQAVAAAREAGLRPSPPQLEPHQVVMMAELRAANGREFESLYVRQQVMGHQGALAVQRTYAMRGDQAPLRRAASQTVPVVQSHLAEVERMAMAMPMR